MSDDRIFYSTSILIRLNPSKLQLLKPLDDMNYENPKNRRLFQSYNSSILWASVTKFIYSRIGGGVRPLLYPRIHFFPFGVPAVYFAINSDVDFNQFRSQNWYFVFDLILPSKFLSLKKLLFLFGITSGQQSTF